MHYDNEKGLISQHVGCELHLTGQQAGDGLLALRFYGDIVVAEGHTVDELALLVLEHDAEHVGHLIRGIADGQLDL